MESLENLEVWKRACRLSVKMYTVMTTSKEYGFKDQITRAALSIPSNIAEGYERETDRTCIQFLKIAKGSCGELWTQLMIGRAAGFIGAKYPVRNWNWKRKPENFHECSGGLYATMRRSKKP